MRLYLNSFHESRNFPRKGTQYLLSYSEPQICDSTEYKAKLSNRTLRTKYLPRKWDPASNCYWIWWLERIMDFPLSSRFPRSFESPSFKVFLQRLHFYGQLCVGFSPFNFCSARHYPARGRCLSHKASLNAEKCLPFPNTEHTPAQSWLLNIQHTLVAVLELHSRHNQPANWVHNSGKSALSHAFLPWSKRCEWVGDEIN